MLGQFFVYCMSFGADSNQVANGEEINDIKSLLEEISAGLDSLKSESATVDLPLMPDPLEEISEEEAAFFDTSKPSINSDYSVENAEDYFDEKKHSLEGYYIRPFLGAVMSNQLEWNSFLGGRRIDGSSGVSGGLSAGYELRNFFADLQLSYFQYDLRSIDVPNLPFKGEVDGIGIHLSGGGRIYLSQNLAVFCGLGFGGVSQDVSFTLVGDLVNESDFLFSGQIFTGLEFRPTDYTIIGLRYRWLVVEQMQSFSDRSLHLAELSAGYLF